MAKSQSLMERSDKPPLQKGGLGIGNTKGGVYTTILRGKKKAFPEEKALHIRKHNQELLLVHIPLNIVVVRTVAVEGCLIEGLLCRWVSHRDNKTGTLLQALTIQIYSTILGYKPVDVVTSSNDTCTLGEDIRNF